MNWAVGAMAAAVESVAEEGSRRIERLAKISSHQSASSAGPRKPRGHLVSKRGVALAHDSERCKGTRIHPCVLESQTAGSIWRRAGETVRGASTRSGSSRPANAPLATPLLQTRDYRRRHE